MGASFPEPTPVRGKRLVPLLLIGFFVLAVVGTWGTQLIANWTAPYLKKQSAAARAQLEKDLREGKRR